MSHTCCSVPVVLMSLDDLSHYRGVIQCGDIPETVHLPHGHLPENSPHDLSRASLRETLHHLTRRDEKQEQVSILNISKVCYIYSSTNIGLQGSLENEAYFVSKRALQRNPFLGKNSVVRFYIALCNSILILHVVCNIIFIFM